MHQTHHHLVPFRIFEDGSIDSLFRWKASIEGHAGHGEPRSILDDDSRCTSTGFSDCSPEQFSNAKMSWFDWWIEIHNMDPLRKLYLRWSGKLIVEAVEGHFQLSYSQKFPKIPGSNLFQCFNSQPVLFWGLPWLHFPTLRISRLDVFSCARHFGHSASSPVGGCLDVAQDRVGVRGGAERWFNKQVNYQFAIEHAPLSSLNPRFSIAESVYSLPEG